MPSLWRERKILIKNIVESVDASTWSRECGDNKGVFKLMVGISGKSTNYSVKCTKIFLLNFSFIVLLKERVLKVEVTGKKEVLYRQLTMIVKGLCLLMSLMNYNKRKI